MVAEDVLAEVDSIFGLHVASALPAGVVGYKAGPFMAAGDFFHARIIGKGGHGGMPHLAVDPIPMTAQIVNGLQTIVSRETDPLESAVVSVCSLEAGKGAYNVLPDAVDLRGTIRYLNQSFGPELTQRVRGILEGVTSAMRGSFEFNLMNRFPATVNDEEMTTFVAGVAAKLLGKTQTLEMKPLLGSEDFSYYLQEVPGTLVFLGIENKEKGIMYPHHHPKFDLDEDVLPTGAALHVAVAMEYLRG
jgi:amidohydrolase